MSALTPQEQNKLMRELLIRNSPKIIKKLPTVTGVMGGTTRIKLNNTGLVTRLFADITIPYNFSAAPTITNKSIYAAVPKIQLIDFDGSTRINTSALHLAILNAMRGRQPGISGAFPQSEAGLSVVASGQSNDFRSPQIGVATGAQNLRFVVEIPVAADVMSGDLRGMLAAQFVSGDLQLSIDFASAINGTSDDDYVFTGGTFVSVGAPTVTVFQEYYLPQKIRGVTAIPQMDISTVYEVGVYSRTTDNIAAGQEKLSNFPILREVNGVIMDFINNKLMGGGSTAQDLDKFVIYANGNNILFESNHFLQSVLQRNKLDTDLPQGCYMFDFSNGPISTAIFGNVQLASTPLSSATMTNPALEISFESLYAKGAALSGAPV